MALARYVTDRFKTKTRAIPNPVTDTVGIGVTKVANNNPDRLFLLIINLSDTDLYAGFFVDPSATKGLFLAKNGGSISVSAEEDAELVGYDWHIYSSAAGKKIFVLEMEGE